MDTYDIAVIGVGGMGASVVAHAAWRGLSVIGLEQYSLPHRRGSSYGITRILRLGLHEGPTYVPLVFRAVELWKELGQKSGVEMFHNSGSFDVALPDSPIFRGSLAACQKFDIEHEVLDARELHRRFPGVTPDDDMLAVHQPGSGFVLSDASMEAHINLALAAGAQLRGHETVLGWKKKGELFLIETNRAKYLARNLVVTTGAWANKLLPTIPVKVERQVVGWFQPKESPELFGPQRMPAWIMDSPEHGHYYGLPIFGIPGFKLSKFFYGDVVDPSGPLPPPSPQEEDTIRLFLKRYFPKANGPAMTLGATFFENTPDRDFILDHAPGDKNLWLCLGFSGHGYKYVPAIGELMVDLVTTGKSTFDLSPFLLQRFAEAN
jgi:sarcosine oxidase